MPTPIFALRLPQKIQDDLGEIARIYGAPSTRAFAREILEVMVSGEVERVKAFNGRLMMKMGEQMTLRLNASLDEGALHQKRARKRKPAPVDTKRRRKR